MAEWVSAFRLRQVRRVVLGSNPAAATSLRNFGNSVYPALPVSFGRYTKIRRPLRLSGEVKYPTSQHWKCLIDRGLHTNLREGQL